MAARKDSQRVRDVRSRIEKWDKYWRVNRQQWYQWIQFVMGDQWREDESRLFERYNKIPLTMNKLGVLSNHLLGEQRQNTPQLQCIPDGNVAEQTIEIRSSLVKQISLNSEAQIGYQNAFQHSTIGGFGAIRVGVDYVHEQTFDQEVRFYKVDDPCRCYWDIGALNASKTDGMYCGERTRMSRKRFAALYGEELERSIGASSGTEDVTLSFADDDSITIISDFEREAEKFTLYLLSNGVTINDDEFSKLDKVKVDKKKVLLYQGEPVTVEDKRDSYRYTIKHQLIAGDYILEETEFPSEQLPIVFVDQNSFFDKNGQQITRSFFQDVKDAQRYINYLATQSAYIMKVSRYDQFIAPRKAIQAADTQAIWRDPSAQMGALFYDETPGGGKPEQLRPPELAASLSQQYERAMMDIATGTGIYNTMLGERGNEISGTAIDARTKRGSYNTYIPFDSLNRAIATCGQIVNEMIPKVYNTERQMLINTPNRQNAPVTLNKQVDPYGMMVENDMTEGRFRIRLMPGPSYDGQKQEALESMQMILQNDPSLFKLIGDLYVENLPLPNYIELRNRIRTIIPPEIIQAGKTGEPIQQDNQQPSPDQMMAAAKQQEIQLKMQQAEQDAANKQKQLDLQMAELQRKAIESHQDMTMQWAKFEKEKEEAAAQLQERLLSYQAELHRTDTDFQIAHAQNIIKLLTHHPKEPKETIKRPQ